MADKAQILRNPLAQRVGAFASGPDPSGWPTTPIHPEDQPLIDKVVGWIRGDDIGSDGEDYPDAEGLAVLRRNGSSIGESSCD